MRKNKAHPLEVAAAVAAFTMVAAVTAGILPLAPEKPAPATIAPAPVKIAPPTVP
jgi:hypothetical protein